MDGFIAHDPESEIQTAPQNLDAEQALLGALMYDNELYHQISGFLKPDHFYDPIHARIYETCSALISSGTLGDAVALKTALEGDEGLAELGGATAYLALLSESAAHSAAAPEYAKIIVQLSQRRELIRVGDEICYAARQDSAREVASIIEDGEARLASMTDTEEGEGFYTAGQALRDCLDNPTQFIPTGLEGFDKVRAIAPGLSFIGGRSSMGKSALLCDIIRRVAAKGRPCLLLSNEMTQKQIAARWAAAVTGVSYSDITDGYIKREDRQRVSDAIAELDALPITIIVCPGVGIAGIRARIRRWLRAQEKAGKEPGVVGIDYLQNIAGKGNGLYEKTSEIALGLQTIQLTFEICLIVACQLARAAEQEKDKRPAIRHMRDSGKIEEVADKIFLVYRDAYYAERETPEDDPDKEFKRRERAGSKLVEVDLAKNRQGQLRQIELVGEMAVNKFEDWDAC